MTKMEKELIEKLERTCQTEARVTLRLIRKLQKELNNSIPVKKVEQLINKIKNETWYIESGTEAKQACIEELESLLNKE